MKIEVKDLTKKFQNQVVLGHISMTMESGHIYGLIGRNGSGKSVFLKILCGFYMPTAGEILFDGKNYTKKNRFYPALGALIEKPMFLPNLTGFENLELLASIKNKITKEDILDALKKVNLLDEKDKKYKKYSLGMKQKLGIAQAFMENPDVIILDEPFNGAEEETAIALRNMLKELKKQGKLIILATHMKEDVMDLSDVIYEVQNGKFHKQEK